AEAGAEHVAEDDFVHVLRWHARTFQRRLHHRAAQHRRGRLFEGAAEAPHSRPRASREINILRHKTILLPLGLGFRSESISVHLAAAAVASLVLLRANCVHVSTSLTLAWVIAWALC